MIATKYFASLIVFAGATMAQGLVPPACAGSNANAANPSSAIHLLCDLESTVQNDPGASRYLCKPEGNKQTFEADVTVKKSNIDKATRVQSIVFTNKVSGNKVYQIVSGIADGKKSYYWTLQSNNTCSVTGTFARQIGSFDPTSVYVFDQKRS